MIIPKSKVSILEEALQAYLKIKYRLSEKDQQTLFRIVDKCHLVIQGDATGLQVSQVYGNINAKVHPPNLLVDGDSWSERNIKNAIKFYMFKKYGMAIDLSDIHYEW